jgi:hypothetical protein
VEALETIPKNRYRNKASRYRSKEKTTTGDKRFLRLQALRNRTHTARNLQKHLVRTRGTRISDQTVCNRLREAELRARRSAKFPKLTREHR